MKTVLLVILGCVLLLSCEKQEYESWRTFPDVSKVTRVNLSPNSPVLIADGKAELTFKVKAYMGVEDIRTIELENEDGVIVKDSTFRDTIEIKEDRIPKEDIKIYLEDGTPVDWAFRTTEHAGETLRFKASVYGVESEVREVRIIEKPEVNFEHITIPLIFHLLYKEDEAYQYENITTEMLQGMVDRLNRVMKNDMINAPSSVDLNVTFELAETDNLGKPLKERGINRVQLWDGIDGNSYINDYLIWDLDKYLNIWVGEHQDEYSLRIQYPQYILDNGSELQMDEWRTLQKVESVEDASYWGSNPVSGNFSGFIPLGGLRMAVRRTISVRILTRGLTCLFILRNGLMNRVRHRKMNTRTGMRFISIRSISWTKIPFVRLLLTSRRCVCVR